MSTITYYISLNSPWTYLGSQRFRDMAARHGYTVDLYPARFAQVFEKTGGLPLPKRAPERRAYRLQELKRWRDFLAIPITIEPKHFPSDEVPGTRLVIAAKLAGLDAHLLSLEIGRALWEREENIGEEAVLDAAAARAGLDAAAIRAGAPSAGELDAHWDRYTAEAIGRGVFGAPSYVLPTGEIFWGQDRLPLLDWRLGQGKV
jgi:2-hydroxychromene-2-carboxylate isomerase